MTLHVESVGAGAPLVLLHGWALHGGIFAPLLPELSMRYRVHVIDLPGHGHSAPLLPYTLDSVTDALMQAIDGIDGADKIMLQIVVFPGHGQSGAGIHQDDITIGPRAALQ